MPARKIINWEGGSDARYDTSQMAPVGDGRLFDGTFYYDSEGRPLDAIPGGNEWTAGLPGARGGTGPGDMGGGSSLSGPGFSNPYFQQAQAAVNAARTADAAARRAAIQQALIQFGLVPDNVADPYGDIDQTTRNLAGQNTTSGISVAARLREALQDAQRRSSRELTARGLRRSGARGYQMRRNQLGYDRSYSDALGQLLSGINTAYQGFAQGEYGRQMSLASALQQALASYSSFGGGGGGSSGGTPSTPPPTFSAPTIGSGSGGTGTAFGPAAGTSSGGYTSPKKPLLME